MTSRMLFILCGFILAASLSLASDRPSGHSKNGFALYQQHCLKCHGAKLDGKGPEAAKLSTPPTDFHKYLSRVKGDLELEVTIRRGRQATAMHEWESRFADQEVYDLIAYLRSAVPHLEVKP